MLAQETLIDHNENVVEGTYMFLLFLILSIIVMRDSLICKFIELMLLLMFKAALMECIYHRY